MELLADDNVIYTFHDYEPFAFTHQGATWTDPEVVPLRSVPYPATEGNVAANLEEEPTLEGQWFVEQYALGHWDLTRLRAMARFAARWSQIHHAPVYCGEFGVHRPFAKPADRDRWLHDMRTALEEQHIGWALWDYQTNFGVVSKAGGATTPDAGMLESLGLAKP